MCNQLKKENATSETKQAKNIQESWKTMKRPNINNRNRARKRNTGQNHRKCFQQKHRRLFS